MMGGGRRLCSELHAHSVAGQRSSDLELVLGSRRLVRPRLRRGGLQLAAAIPAGRQLGPPHLSHAQHAGPAPPSLAAPSVAIGHVREFNTP